MRTKIGQDSGRGRESAAAVEAAAAAWAARIDRGPLSDKEQAELEAWAARDSRHAGAYARALAVNAYLDRARALGPSFAPADHPIARAVERRRLLIGGGAVAAAAVVGVAGYQFSAQQGRIVTRRGDIRRAPLADGSAVTLNTDTAVRAAYDRSAREVVLLHGEAMFDVVKDPARPFVVTAGDVRVRAVGTSFIVRARDDGAIDVVVREGVVDVWRRGEEGASVRMAAQTRIQAAKTGRLVAQPMTLSGLDSASAWREGFIELDGIKLGQAVAELARYSDRRIRIDDPALAELKVAGRYSATDPDGFAKAAALSLGLVATPLPDGTLLTRNSGGS